MKRTLTGQLGIIIVVVLFLSMIISSITNYKVSYEKTYEAAGIEAVGCANITTGLVDPNDVEEIISGNKDPNDLKEILNWTTNHKSIFEGQYILSLDGTILAQDSNMEQQGFKAGDKFHIDKSVLKTIQETKHPHYSEIYEFGGMKRITGYAPIFKDHDPNKEIIALNAIDFNAKIVNERTWESVKDSFILGLLPMLIACVITILVIRRKTKPLTTLIDNAKKVAEGDLSVKDINVKNTDEIGDLAFAFNEMANNLRVLIKQVSLTTNQLAASAEQLTASSEQSSSVSKQIAETMNEVAIGVDNQVQNVEDASQTVNKMALGVQQISNNAESVSNLAINSSNKASAGSQSVNTAKQQMSFINHKFTSLSEVVGELGVRSEEIGKIIVAITGIAEQTNLLALNAAIEAARAGEHGRGFAVVADEVRKLSEQSAESSKEISQLVSMIQSETIKVVQFMEEMTREVDAGIGYVNNAGESFAQIEGSINEVTAQIQGVSSAVNQLAVGAKQVEQSMQFISGVSEETASGVQEVSASTEEQTATMEEISSSAAMLSKMAEELQTMINRFKLH
ncbi:HAMP domain-containing methyl-accepting chemotaxis protein [Fredinandcohnia sp. QZ13]|uniref:methyl-accepting chemotaxis protein n=1 Tax=Fredinandcohnia sp. QZ13 TaxID=3073144 RepID=UPI002852FFE2|nr:HAMP domain-containing methyl-accepting chemotaxis protein [Fredinandcohnia sp. QZ13]MDR4887854.1 HAMP domain-containing methyl-accepting chemotaxis protein [Fredinandcohnia sp. QZ13]